jgi:hypothetical protein
VRDAAARGLHSAQPERRFEGALGDKGIAAQRDQLLDAVARCVPRFDPELEGVDRAHAEMEARERSGNKPYEAVDVWVGVHRRGSKGIKPAVICRLSCTG